jgi:uncharacterized protein YceK
MKNILMMIMVLGFASCASTHKSNESREVASASPKCELVKHKKENWFRVEKDGQPFSKYWYGQGKAQARFQAHISNGHCSQE